jgi:hypothetical protein
VYIYNIHTVFVFCGFHSQDLSFPLPPTALGKLLEASSASAEIRIVLMAGCSQQLAIIQSKYHGGMSSNGPCHLQGHGRLK